MIIPREGHDELGDILFGSYEDWSERVKDLDKDVRTIYLEELAAANVIVPEIEK